MDPEGTWTRQSSLMGVMATNNKKDLTKRVSFAACRKVRLLGRGYAIPDDIAFDPDESEVTGPRVSLSVFGPQEDDESMADINDITGVADTAMIDETQNRESLRPTCISDEVERDEASGSNGSSPAEETIHEYEENENSIVHMNELENEKPSEADPEKLYEDFRIKAKAAGLRYAGQLDPETRDPRLAERLPPSDETLGAEKLLLPPLRSRQHMLASMKKRFTTRHSYLQWLISCTSRQKTLVAAPKSQIDIVMRDAMLASVCMREQLLQEDIRRMEELFEDIGGNTSAKERQRSCEKRKAVAESMACLRRKNDKIRSSISEQTTRFYDKSRRLREEYIRLQGESSRLEQQLRLENDRHRDIQVAKQKLQTRIAARISERKSLLHTMVQLREAYESQPPILPRLRALYDLLAREGLCCRLGPVSATELCLHYDERFSVSIGANGRRCKVDLKNSSDWLSSNDFWLAAKGVLDRELTRRLSHGYQGLLQQVSRRIQCAVFAAKQYAVLNRFYDTAVDVVGRAVKISMTQQSQHIDFLVNQTGTVSFHGPRGLGASALGAIDEVLERNGPRLVQSAKEIMPLVVNATPAEIDVVVVEDD